MTIDDVREQLDRIRQISGDPEAAHSAEDAMRENVLLAIAHGRTDDPAALATEALRSGAIDFPRWTA